MTYNSKITGSIEALGEDISNGNVKSTTQSVCDCDESDYGDVFEFYESNRVYLSNDTNGDIYY